MKLFIKKIFFYLLIIGCLFILKSSYYQNASLVDNSLIPSSIKSIMLSYQIDDEFYYEISKYETFNEDKFLDYYFKSNTLPKPLNYIYLLNSVNYPNFLSFTDMTYPAIKIPITLTNPKFYLKNDYVPKNLVSINEFNHIMRDFEMQFSEDILAAYQRLNNFLIIHNQKITIYSAYRSYNYQKNLYKPDNPYTAKPGHSEHQTGLAIDISTLNYGLSINLSESNVYRLLCENAHLFGFILRYPKDKEKLTGYPFEPWHFRYVGPDISGKMYDENLCLEEYFYRYVLLNY